MSEETPERLKRFRTQYSTNMRPFRWLGYIQIAILILGFGAVLAFVRDTGDAASPNQDGPSSAGLSTAKLREYAVYLAERQEPGAAIEAYQDYLDRATLEPEARAKVCYSVAKLAIEAQRFEEALKYLYQAEFLAPDSDLKDEINKKVVLCLDKLGRRVDLRKELRKRTRVKRTAEDVGGGEVALAEFAGEVLTDRDLAIEIEKLPPYMRGPLEDVEKKAEFLKNLVAQRLLIDKARRLELDEDPEIQEQMARQFDALIVQKLIADEVQSRIHVTDEDVERFYKASLGMFTEAASAEVRIGRADSAEAVQAIEKLPEKGVAVRQGGRIPGVPATDEVLEAIFAAQAGDRVGPYELEKAWYVFEVVSKTPERLKPFEEVEGQARRLYEMQKRQEELSALIERILEERAVKLHLDRLKGPSQ